MGEAGRQAQLAGAQRSLERPALLGVEEAGGQAQLAGAQRSPERPALLGVEEAGGQAQLVGAQCSPEWSSLAPLVVFTQQFHLRLTVFQKYPGR